MSSADAMSSNFMLQSVTYQQIKYIVKRDQDESHCRLETQHVHLPTHAHKAHEGETTSKTCILMWHEQLGCRFLQ